MTEKMVVDVLVREQYLSDNDKQEGKNADELNNTLKVHVHIHIPETRARCIMKEED